MDKLRFELKRRVAALLTFTMFFYAFTVPAYAEPVEIDLAPANDPVAEGDILADPVVTPEAAYEAQNDLLEDAKVPDATPTDPVNDGKTEDMLQADSFVNPAAEGSTDEGVSYIDADGHQTTTPEGVSVNVLTGSETELTPGWYVVSENSTLNYNHSVIMSEEGEYHIILADTGKMNFGSSSSPIGDRGINGSGYSLTIYGQSGGTGELNIFTNADEGHALSAKNIIINGGIITANTTGGAGYAIYGEHNTTINGGVITANTTGNAGYTIYSEGNITINDGDINAYTTAPNVHAIWSKGDITVNKGKITAVTNNYDAVGLKAGGNIFINGGEVYAESRSSHTEGDNLGIMAGGKITFNGGRVTAKGNHAGIYSTNTDPLYFNFDKDAVTDYVSTNKIELTYGNVTIAPGLTLTDGKDNYYVKDNASAIKNLTDVTLRPSTDPFYTVSFDCGGYTSVPPMQLLKEGSKVTKPTDPKENTNYNGLSFAGWYRDSGYQIPYNFDSEVKSNLKLYAKWANKSNDMANADVKMIYRHTGGDIDPVVKNNVGTKLTKGDDYDITSFKFVKTGSTVTKMKDPGFYDLTVTGKSSYTGSKTVRVCVLTFGECDPSTKELNNNATLPVGEDAAVITASTVSMNSGWYVVTENVSVNSRLKVDGDVHLVLCDGATLEAGGNKGISVREGNSLTIYSQEGNTGKLIAGSNEVNFYAGIGGDCADSSKNGNFPYLKDYGYGNGNAGTITIHGGVIEARGSKYSAAIGKAGKINTNGNGGRIIIYGGQITALRYTQIVNTDNDGEKETGIGGLGADIRLSWCRESGAGSDFIVSDGYEGNVTFAKPFIIAGTSTLAKADNIKGEKTRIEPTESGETYTVTFDSQGGTAIEPQGVILGKTAKKPVTPIKEGYRFEGWYNNGILYGFSTPVNDNLTLTAQWQSLPTVSYLNENGDSTQTAYSPMEADYTVLPTGNYYVGEEITLPERVRVEGKVNLILGDGKTLTAPKGISVMDSKNSLNIFGQSGGTGLLKANAASGNAAIGGNKENDVTERPSGNINIYGGMIRALGGENGASIGGGLNSKNYGNIRIYGGTVLALSPIYGSAIGGGRIESSQSVSGGGMVEIRGGVVTVSADILGTGIGGGDHVYGGVISILGGQVTVNVLNNKDCSGIGDGYSSITLGCSRDDDFIYSAGYSGSVKIAPNQTLLIDDDHSIKLAGNITDLTKITGKKLILGHSHSFIYTANGSAITAKCQNPNCDLTNNTATLTLNAPDASTLVYDGTPKPAVVTDQFNISGDAVVKYRKKKSDSSWGEAVAVAPKDAGDYRASITLADTGQGTATASIEYTIKKRDVTITGLIANDKIYDDTTTASVNDTGMKIEGMVSGDAVSVNSGIANFNSPDAGDNKTVTFTNYSLTGEAAGNYNLAQPAPTKANISKRPVTIRALDQTVQLGDSIEYAIDYKDLADGQELKHVDLTPNPDPAHCNTPTDNGTITPANAVIKIRNTNTDVTKNYEITYVNGSLKIILARAKVTKAPTARLNLKYEGYLNWQELVNPGEAETKMEYNVLQIARGDGELLKKDGKYVRDIKPTEGYGEQCRVWESGSYHVWYRAASDNRHASSVPQCISVDVATVPLTVRVRDAAISYGEKFPDNMVLDSEGYVNSEDSGLMGNRKYDYKIGGSWKVLDDVKNMYPDLGSYPVRITYYRASTDTGPTVLYCYDISYIPGIMTVEPRTVGLNWETSALTFNGTPQVPTVTLTNLSANEAPDAVGVTVTGAQVDATPSGQKYTATAASLIGEKAGKYRLPENNTIDFSIAKAAYSGPAIPNVTLNVPVSSDSFTASVAGKMPLNAGKITYNVKTKNLTSSSGNVNDFTAVADGNGLVTVTKKQNASPINAGDKLTLSVGVDSTNYNSIDMLVEATFVDKYDAGVTISEGNALSRNYVADDNFTLHATAARPGGDAVWTWESSNTNVATVAGGGSGISSDCTVTVKGAGITAIAAKYEAGSTVTGSAVLILTVNPISIPIPEAITGLTYTGNPLTGVTSGSGYSLTGEKETAPGSHVAVAALTDPQNCRWSDGTADVKYISWNIEKKPGPSAPAGLVGVMPTTAENIDGKITGVDETMEYSKDASFSRAIPCVDTSIIGLAPGTYYVRIKETETTKAGAVAAVEIKAVVPPVVRAIQGLVYNGSPQALVEADEVSDGKIYYAVTGRGDPEPAKGQYTTRIPTKTDAGKFIVWYEIRRAESTTSSWVYAEIGVMIWDSKGTDEEWERWHVSTNGLYGAEGMLDVSECIPPGENPTLHVISSETWGILKYPPTIDQDTAMIHYYANRDEDISHYSPNRYVLFTVSVSNLRNYKQYDMPVMCYFKITCPDNHAETVPLHNEKVPNCTEKGHTEDLWCQCCHAIIKGEDIPIDPNNHDFDYSTGDITKEPTTISYGEHTYYCTRNHAHTITIADIPNLPSKDGTDYNDFAKDTKGLSGNMSVKQTTSTNSATGQVTETVTLGGEEISKTVKDPESGKEIVETKVWIGGLESSYTYTGSAIKPDFHVYDGTKKLTEKTDYTVSWKNNKVTGIANATVKFKGNYKGVKAQTLSFEITPAVLGKDIIAHDTGAKVTNKAQKPVPTLTWAATGKTVSARFFNVTYGGEESVKGEGTYTATITSKNKNYDGTTTANVKIVGKKGALLSKAKVSFDPKSYVYTGSEIIPQKGSYKLKLDGKELVEGTDYKLAEVMNNSEPGTANVVFEAIGTAQDSPVGTKTATFKITGGRKLTEAGRGSDFTYDFSDSVPYAKGGAKPAVVVKDKGVTLKEGKDYTLSYSKNKALTNGYKSAEIKVKGKGNYKGSIILNFAITKQSLKADGIIVRADDQFTTKSKIKKPTVTVTDVDGKKLKSGTDYTLGDPDTSASGNTEESGEVTVVVTGKGNYREDKSVRVSFRYMKESANISKTKKMKNISDQIYTGNEVRLDDTDLKEILYTGKRDKPDYLVPGTNFVVESYSNNIKKGTAKVVVRGIGVYAGTKTLTFKIKESASKYRGALIGGQWE